MDEAWDEATETKAYKVAVGSAINIRPTFQSCLGPLHALCPQILLSYLHANSSWV